ncbi:hypothetical protein OIU79_001748 [Salix purpurea]|uniref:Uncharacterized protein n=1 Tax=Salix purpurea TaxID=77065 RepID=A0A9Q0UQN9_SALPP|nr:hypothetical protein OIU79_001748 [Salix purpurea]
MKIARLGLFGSDQELFLLLYWKGKEVMVLCWYRRQHRRSDCSGQFSFLKKPFGLT